MVSEDARRANAAQGHILSLLACNGMLFSGSNDSCIHVWKFDPASSTFDPAVSLPPCSLSSVWRTELDDRGCASSFAAAGMCRQLFKNPNQICNAGIACARWR